VRIIVVLNFFNPFSTLSSAHFAIKRYKANIPIKIPQNVPPIIPVPTRCTSCFILILSSGLQIIPKKSNLLFLSDFVNDSSPISKPTYLQVLKRPFFLPPLFSEEGYRLNFSFFDCFFWFCLRFHPGFLFCFNTLLDSLFCLL
jgi:hypothetical protein